jgi:hypothetical protein
LMGLQIPTDIFLLSSTYTHIYSQFTGKVFNVCKRTVRPSHDDHDLFIIIIDPSWVSDWIEIVRNFNGLKNFVSFCSFCCVCVCERKEEVYEALTGASPTEAKN